MENRRNINTNSDKPFNRENQDNREKYPKKTDDRAPYGERKFQPRPEGFRPKQEGSQPRTDGYRPKPEGFRPKTEGFRPKDGKFQPRQGTNTQSRDNKFQPRDNRFQPRDNRFQNKPAGKFDPKQRFPARGTNPAEAWKKNDNSHIKITSEMQVTDGKHRGKFLQSTTSPKVRPTTRKIRESMFKIILRRVRGGRFLDLCAGSGAVGIEAISRGALLGTFVERSAKMCSFIKKNMATMEIKEGHGEIHEIEVQPFLKQMAKRRRQWDVVFLDPPYDANYDEILEFFKRGVCVKVNGLLIIEHHSEMFFPEKLGVLKRWRVVVEGDSALSFYERK